MKNMKTLFKEYWQIVKKRKWIFLILILSMLTHVSVELGVTIFYKDLANNFINVFSEEVYIEIIKIFFIILGLFAFQWIMWRVYEYLIIPFQVGGEQDCTIRCFNVLEKQKYQFFQNEFSGSIVKKSNRFIKNYTSITDWFFFTGLINTYALCLSFIILYFHDVFLSIIFIIWGVLYMIISGGLFLWKMKYDEKASEEDSKIGGLFSDIFSNIFTVKTAGIKENERQKVLNQTNIWYEKTRISWLLALVIFGVQTLLMLGLELFVLYIMIQKWKNGTFNIGEFVLFQTVLLYIFNSLFEFGRSLRNLFRAMAESSEMVEIIENSEIEIDLKNAKDIKINKGEIEFRNIDFSFKEKDNNLFDNFSLNIPSKQKLALVGHSGAGKTTITNLLFRFFDIQKGQILFDNIDNKSFTLDSLRKQISLVSQSPEMFHRTIKENVTLGKNYTEEEIINSLKKAEAYDFVMSLPKGIETEVGERGVKLSGGEKQRISIARSFLENSPIVVLDEATSALDSITENKIQKGIMNLIKNKTAIVIAHRLSTIMQMDRIIVMAKGKIIEEGSHENLIKENGQYAKMWHHQKGGFLVE
jgi:ATP-binding cassette subfamily B protein